MTADVLGAIIYALPSSIFGANGVYPGLHTEPPSAVYPHCRIDIIGERDRGSTGRGRDTSRLSTADVVGETHTYSTGDESTLLDERDVDTITALTASAYVGTPPLVEDRDYELADSGASLQPTSDSIGWLPGAVVLPADGATITVDYRRNVVAQRHHIAATYMARAVIHAKGDASGPAASQAQRLGLELRAWLEAMAGTDIQTDPNDHPIILERPTGPGRSTGPDRGMSIATWAIDFPVITGIEADLGDVRRVRKVETALETP